MKVDVKKLLKSQIEITFELSSEEFKEHVSHTLEHLKEHIKVDGFRQGNVPDKIAEEKIGKENLLMEAGDHAVKHVYYDYIAREKLEPIGQPEISIIKVAQGSEFIFKAKIEILPEIELPDYKEIARKVKGKDISVDEKEVEDSLNYLQKTRAKFFQQDKPAEKDDFVEIEYQSKDLDNNKLIKDKFILGQAGMIKGFEEAVLGMKAGEEKEVSIKFPENSLRKDLAGKDVVFKIKIISVQKMELPEINDEFAKTLGAFDTLVALKEGVKTGIHKEKTEEEKQRKRAEILDRIAEKTHFEVPPKMLEYEKDRLFEDLKNNISQNFKITFQEYLASVKKTEEEIKKTFEKEAEKRLKSFLVLRQIGKTENIKVDDKEVQEEVDKNLKIEKFKNSNDVDTEQLKEYTKGVIFNEKIFNLLENLK
jgi:trigger factor